VPKKTKCRECGQDVVTDHLCNSCDYAITYRRRGRYTRKDTFRRCTIGISIDVSDDHHDDDIIECSKYKPAE